MDTTAIDTAAIDTAAIDTAAIDTTEIDTAEIRSKIKEIIANVTNIDPAEINDVASFIDDLQLDSLSLLEIGVDVDYEYQLGVPEERLSQLRTVQDAVDLVVAALRERTAAELVA